MSDIERRAFEIRVAGRDLSLELGKCACVLFREQQEVDYLTVNVSDEDGDSILRVFNNVELTRWLAGICLEGGHPYGVQMNDHTFAELYGWNPATVIKQQPSETELDWFLDVNTRDIEEEWNSWES